MENNNFNLKREARKRVLIKKYKPLLNPMVVIMFIILVAYSFTLCYALFWAFITSIKTRSEFVISKFSLPSAFRLTSYVNAFNNLYLTVNETKVYLLQLFLNSLIFAGGHAFITLFSTSLCAYVCNKYRNRFTRFIYNVVIVMMIIPIPSSLGASIEFNMKLGVYDNLPMIFYTCIGFNTGNFLVCYATFAAISWSYAESAFIDGAGHFKVFFTMYLPLAMVPLTILFVLAFVSFWNNFMTPLIYLPSFPTAAVALYRFQWSTVQEISNTPTQMAAAMLVCLPCLALFFAFKDKMVGSLTMGGLKG